MTSLALFDLHGALTDPVPGLISCHRYALDQIGVDFEQAVTDQPNIGMHEAVRLPAADLYQLLGVADSLATETARRFREHRVVAGWIEDVLYPGIDELLAQLTSAGWRIAVATNQLEPLAIRILDRLEVADRFEVIAGSDTARTRTNKAEIIGHAINELGGQADGTAVIADRASDIAAAKAAQMTAIGAAWGFGSIEELMGAEADAIAVTPSDVAELLLGDA